jgi:PhnB protein
MASGPNPPPTQAYICVTNGMDAIAFYETAFGAVCAFKKMADDGRRVMHANRDVYDNEVMRHDEFPEFGGILMRSAMRGRANVGIHINLHRVADVEAAVKRAEKRVRSSCSNLKIHSGARAAVRRVVPLVISGHSTHR